MSTNTAPTSTPRRAAGFSLVELMVSVVVGLLALAFATRMIVGSEQNKAAALGGSDAMQNGMLALFSIDDDISQAGFGLNDPIAVGCDTVFADVQGYVLAAATRGGVAVRPAGAAVIVPGAAIAGAPGGTAPDTISLYSGSSLAGTATVRLSADYASGTQLNIDRVAYGFAQRDVILVAPETPGGKCALAQISNDPTVPTTPQTIRIAPGTAYRYNSGGLGSTFKANQARVFNLGPDAGLALHTWSVADGFLQLRSTNLSGAAATPATVIDNVVSIKAQYGFDTRAPLSFLPEAGMQIGQWSSAMIDADGDGVVGGAGDYQRVAALRIAVIARSKAIERAPATGCTTTTALPVVFASAQPQGIAAVPVAVNVIVAGDPVDWKCYRYRVFETIVPLRNSGWRPTAS
jgi:type IV pilus assembly protein PilW